MKLINIPNNVEYILQKLMENGFKAYIVGGCVRDSLINLLPHDWDICTSAKPEQVLEIFNNEKIIKTGIKHGTVTIILDEIPYEVTTFRIDGKYEDNRHPSDVSYVSDVSEDLKRRDFTINAMAYNNEEGLIDLFGGYNDLKQGIIRCVGNPYERFCEDALRIMRAIRFAARYNFFIEPETLKSILFNKDLLKNIAKERINNEITRIFQKAKFNKNNAILIKYLYIIMQNLLDYENRCSINELINKFLNFQEQNDILEFRLAIFFDNDNIKDILTNLKFSNNIISKTCEIHSVGYKIYNEMWYWASENNMLKVERLLINKDKTGFPYYSRELLHEIKCCNIMDAIDYANCIYKQTSNDVLEFKLLKAQTLICLSRKDVYKLSALNIDGNDILEIGYKGKMVGKVLDKVLYAVMNDRIKNSKRHIKKYIKNLKYEDLNEL